MFIFFTILLVMSVILVVRNSITYERQIEAVNLVRDYCMYLIDHGKYEKTKDYYKEMIISYPSYLFALDLWGKYSAIKPKYKNELKPFIE